MVEKVPIFRVKRDILSQDFHIELEIQGIRSVKKPVTKDNPLWGYHKEYTLRQSYVLVAPKTLGVLPTFKKAIAEAKRLGNAYAKKHRTPVELYFDRSCVPDGVTRAVKEGVWIGSRYISYGSRFTRWD